MLCHFPSPLDDKKVSSKDINHFTIALAEKLVDSADGLCFENYDVSVIDLSGIYSFSKFSLKANKTKR